MKDREKDTHFGGVGKRRLQDRPVNEVTRMSRVTRVTGGRLRVKRVARRNFVMVEKTTG